MNTSLVLQIIACVVTIAAAWFTGKKMTAGPALNVAAALCFATVNLYAGLWIAAAFSVAMAAMNARNFLQWRKARQITLPLDYPSRDKFFFPKNLRWAFFLRQRVALNETRGCMADMRRFRQMGTAIGSHVTTGERYVRVRLDDGSFDILPLRLFSGHCDGHFPKFEYHWS